MDRKQITSTFIQILRLFTCLDGISKPFRCVFSAWLTLIFSLTTTPFKHTSIGLFVA
jgi:hypothetical protein